MITKYPVITLNDAYWWINDLNAKEIRPPIRELLDSVSEAHKAGDRKTAESICQRFCDREYGYLPDSLKLMVDKLINAVIKWDNKDIETALKSLKNSRGSYLQPSTSKLVLQMRSSVVTNKPEEAWIQIKKLRELQDKLPNGLEAGEILVECGRAAFVLNYWDEAVEILNKVSTIYKTYRHPWSVSQWMVGYILWLQAQSDLQSRNKAILFWQNSLDKFRELAKSSLVTSQERVWYEKMASRMEQSLDYAIGGGNLWPAPVPFYMPTTPPPPPPPPPSTTTTTTPPPPQPPTTTTTTPAPPQPQIHVPLPTETVTATTEEFFDDYSGDFLKAFPILEEIPAGPWKQVDEDPNTVGEVEIGQVLINDQPYYVRNLRGGHIINLPSVSSHVVVKIIGNSMNDAKPIPINNSDYVLVRPQSTAHSGNIVVAKAYDETAGKIISTIKYFTRDSKNTPPYLMPKSSDPKYQKLDIEFEIVGLAIAVFKPIRKKGKAEAQPV